MRRNLCVAGLIAALFLLLLVLHFSLPVDAQTPVHFPNCRLGAAVVVNPITSYNLDGLNLGWYVNYGIANAPLQPGGIEFVQMVRVHQLKHSWQRDDYVVPYTYTVSPNLTALRTLVMANPGLTWAIGNEPDRRDWPGGGQDEIVPELYAQAYHDVSQVIRQADPTAKVAIGGVVQGTALRRKYLDRVWNEYLARYGRRLGDDVDIWNLHSFILREASCVKYPGYECYGAEIPAGLTDEKGLWIGAGDNDDFTLFKQFVRDFRTWMRDKGEQNKPLYITEYGINMPVDWISATRVKSFMNKTFTFLLTEVDDNSGYPMDGYRLVQRFMWYSLDDSMDSPWRVESYADSLFSSVTHLRQDYGDNGAAYVAAPAHPEANVPRVNLFVPEVKTIPLSYSQPTTPVTFTLSAAVYNNGNTITQSGDGITVQFIEGTPATPGSLIGTLQIITDVCGCGQWTVVSQTWVLSPTAGTYPWFVQIEVLPGETSATDNVGTGQATIIGEANKGVYLPIMLKN